MVRLTALALALSLVTAAGCSNRESAQARAPRDTGTAAATVLADGVQQITVRGSEQLRFTPSTVKAHPGRLRIILVNIGTTPHDLKVSVAGQSTGLVRGGERGSVTVTLVTGRYGFVCTLHTRVHMTGTIVVS